MGRPKLDIDPRVVESLAARFCSNREIAAIIGCDESTIRARFPAELEKGRQRGKTELRKMQYDSAKKGSVRMQIWLGKQVLGQMEKQEVHTEVTLDEQRRRYIERGLHDVDRLVAACPSTGNGRPKGESPVGGNGRGGTIESP